MKGVVLFTNLISIRSCICHNSCHLKNIVKEYLRKCVENFVDGKINKTITSLINERRDLK